MTNEQFTFIMLFQLCAKVNARRDSIVRHTRIGRHEIRFAH